MNWLFAIRINRTLFYSIRLTQPGKETIMRNAILVLIGICFVGAAAVFAQSNPNSGFTGAASQDGPPPPPPPPFAPPPPDMLDHMARELGLSDTQKAALKEILDAQKQATDPGRAQMRVLHQQL